MFLFFKNKMNIFLSHENKFESNSLLFSFAGCNLHPSYSPRENLSKLRIRKVAQQYSSQTKKRSPQNQINIP